jgi:YVTN family beta-propeller protein
MPSSFFRLLAAASLLAGAQAAHAQDAFTTLNRTAAAQVTFSGPDRMTPIQAGSTVTVGGEGFQPGQQVTLLVGTTPLGTPLTADAEGKITGTVTVPSNAVSGTHPVVAVTNAPYTALVAELKVSPNVPLSGQDGFTITSGIAARGIYQTAYSPAADAIFVTTSVGRPPVTQSELVKMNPDTLAVLARTTPAAAPATAPRPGQPAREPGLFAVYGVGVDDAAGTVWVTNTRQNTVAVYRQSDLSLVKQFAPETVAHPRDVRVHAGKAYVAATNEPYVAVIDTATMEPLAPIQIQSSKRGETFGGASLSLDPVNNRLYVVSLSSAEVAVIDTATGQVSKVFPLPGARGAIGVSHDPATGRIYVAAQGSDNLLVLDGETGAVIADTPVGAGALNVAFDPASKQAYVTSRGAGTVTVTDANGTIVANLGPAPLANHVTVGEPGVIYAAVKSGQATGEEGDTVMRITPKR